MAPHKILIADSSEDLLQELGNLLTSFEALRAGNVGNEASLGLSYVILVFTGCLSLI